MKNDPFIKAYEHWLRTVNPADYSIKTSNGEINAQQILDEMNNETEFGNNFSNSLEKVHKKLALEPLQNAEPDDFKIHVGLNTYNAKEILEQMTTGKTEFGGNFRDSALSIAIQVIMKSLKKESAP